MRSSNNMLLPNTSTLVTKVLSENIAPEAIKNVVQTDLNAKIEQAQKLENMVIKIDEATARVKSIFEIEKKIGERLKANPADINQFTQNGVAFIQEKNKLMQYFQELKSVSSPTQSQNQIINKLNDQIKVAMQNLKTIGEIRQLHSNQIMMQTKSAISVPSTYTSPAPGRRP